MNREQYDKLSSLKAEEHVLLDVSDIKIQLDFIKNLNHNAESTRKLCNGSTHKLCSETKCFTILYGYDLNRDTVHIYWNDVESKIVVFRYSKYEKTSKADLVDLLTMDHLPTKRVYPAACDFYCAALIHRRLLRFNHYGLPFTTYHERESKTMYGYTVEQFENLMSASSQNSY